MNVAATSVLRFLRRFLVLGCLTCLAVACSKGPTDTYYQMVAAAKMGDRDTFLQTFTDDSRHLIEALIELSEIYGLQRNDPYRLLVHTEVISEEEAEPERVTGIKEPCEAVNLVVKVKHRQRKIKMVKVDGEWRIDAFGLESFWQKRANFRF